jgi:hypothetical protein
MKILSTLIVLSFLVSPVVQAKIVVEENTFFIESKGNRSPISLLNNLAKDKEISQVKLFAEGHVNIVAFAKEGEEEKLYSVSEDGYAYSIAPFTDYEIKEIDSAGLVRFQEDSKNQYRVNSEGFFIR